MIGQSPRRKEDERLLTGRGRYVHDIALADLQHLAIVRSPHARARILGVEARAAKAMDDVAVFAGEDLPELANVLPTFIEPASNPYCDFKTPPPHLGLARGELRHVGEAVVAVAAVAPDRYRAADAAAAVSVEYEPLPAIVNAEAAMSDDAPAVHAHEGSVLTWNRTRVYSPVTFSLCPAASWRALPHQEYEATKTRSRHDSDDPPGNEPT
jgi:carbon-monoxide dehydrogenase large subunit